MLGFHPQWLFAIFINLFGNIILFSGYVPMPNLMQMCPHLLPYRARTLTSVTNDCSYNTSTFYSQTKDKPTQCNNENDNFNNQLKPSIT